MQGRVRRENATARSLKVRIPPNPRYGHRVRQEVVSFAGTHHVSRGDIDDFIFAIGEALANAIEHSDSRDAIEVRCQLEPDKIIASVSDSGRGFETAKLRGRELPDEFCERGRGVPIMRKCTDIFAVRSAPGKGTTVVLGRYLRKPGSEYRSAS